MAFDVRAMENIATAPATRRDRIAAAWLGGVTIAGFAAMIPFADVKLPANASFIPTAISFAVFAQVLTAVLFYVQYRIARSSQLALMTIAYTASSVMSFFYILTFPNAFAPMGLFHANAQSAAWISTFERSLVIALLVAFVFADRFGWRVGRIGVRAFALAVGLVVCTAIFVAINLDLPRLIAGENATALREVAIIPASVAGVFIVICTLVLSGLRTVTQVWLIDVGLLYLAEMFSNSIFSGGRYTVGWYAGRSFSVLAASVLLAVFMFKINDLLIRITGRNRALTERTVVAESEVARGELRYRSLANIVPQLIWTASADGVVDYVNDRWVAFTGLDLEDTATRGWRAALDHSAPVTMRDPWRESLRNGVALNGEFRFREGATGRRRWFLVNVTPLRDGGGIVRWIASCTDIDASKRIEEREVFLATAGDRLSASLDLQATLATIADLVLGRMASWLRVDLVDDDGRFVNALAISDSTPETTALVHLRGRRVESPLENLFTTAHARREPVFFDDVALLAGGATVEGTIAIVVPLSSGDAVLGALTLVHRDRPSPDADDVALARDFGRRAAQALDHARLYERERLTADVLQRAMLPQSMPSIGNVTFSASYSAASESRHVGGDFYDAFLLPDGRVALTIGDVTGHGLEAAVIMGEIRQSLRAAAFAYAGPSSILDRASRQLTASGRAVFATAVFGVLDTATGVFDYATAGHPSPIVYNGHAIIRLASAGLPIGLRDDEGVDFSVTLPPECTIVLFTDGLLEFTRDLDEGERRIERAVSELATEHAGDLAHVLMERVLGSDTATDDIAILTASVRELPRRETGEMREWRFSSNDRATAALVRREVGALAGAWTGEPARAGDSELAFGEAYSNVVRHAPGPVTVRVQSGREGVRVSVADHGPGFDDRGIPHDELAESGRGLKLLRALADFVLIEPNVEGGTTVSVIFATPLALRRNAERAFDGS